MKRVLLILMVAALITAVQAATVEYWDFEDGVAGTPFTDTAGGAPNGSGGSTGVNGTLMRGWDDYWGPWWTGGSPNGTGSLVMDADAEHMDGYLTEGAVHNWSTPEWTLELNVKFDSINGWETMVGRDGSSCGVNESDFYLQRAGDDGTIRIQYVRNDLDTTGSGWDHYLASINTLRSNFVPTTGRWYGLAVTCSTTELAIWIDTGSGYYKDASVDVSGNTDNGVYASTINWTVGRGYWGGFTDRTDAKYDNVRFSNAAIADAADFITSLPEPTTLALLALGGLLLRKRRG